MVKLIASDLDGTILRHGAQKVLSLSVTDLYIYQRMAHSVSIVVRL